MGKILYLNDMEEFFSDTENWKITLNISDIWNNYTNNKLTIEQFNKEYSNRLMSYKENILQLNNDAWNEAYELAKRLINTNNREESVKIYDDIYDWGDKNDVLIKAK